MQWTNIVMVIFALALVFIFSMATFFDKGDKTYELVDGTSHNVLELSDTAKTKVEPDEATINLRIVTRDSSHEEAVNENTQINNKIIEHFEDDYEVISRSYRVRELTQRDPVRPYEDQPPEEKPEGYEVYNTIEIKTEEIQRTGKIVTEAFELGAKEIISINYGLSDEKKRQIQDELVEEAIKAMEKRAESIAEVSGVNIEGILKIAPGSWDYSPMMVRGEEMMDVAQAPSSYQEPEFSPGEEEVSARVSMTYKIG